MILLVPSDPLRAARPDEHFAAEAAAARAAGLDVAVVDHDALTRDGGAEQAVSRVRVRGDAVYRGWMVRAEHYVALAAALARRGVSLRTGPGQYRRAHELPGWYGTLADTTPRSAWTVGAGRDRFDRARAELGAGPAVVRDYTKSMKHHWHEAMFIADLGDAAAAWSVAARFLQLREDDFTGGLVLRRFEDLTSAEVRTWWVDGTCRLVTAHPDSPDDRPPEDLDLGWLTPSIAALRLPFVSVDLALRADGVWRVVEVGDGQVSDRPATTAPEALIDAVRR